MNQGFAFEFNYVDRPWTTMLRLKQFYERFKNGYFTYIDWDGGGRHHVGRFTTPVNPQETSNGKYTAQGILFEEMPGARMVTYPNDYVNWSRTINVLDDYLNPQVASFSAAPNAWVTQINPTLGAVSSSDPTAYELYNANPTAGDFAQVEYVGWGFTMTYRIAENFGLVYLFIDGVQVLELDMSVPQSGGFYGAAGVFQGTYTDGVFATSLMALDKHRVKLVASGAAGAGGGNAIIYPPITVIV